MSVNFLKAEDKVSYIDIDYVLTNTIAGKELLNKLEKEEKLKNQCFAILQIIEVYLIRLKVPSMVSKYARLRFTSLCC